MESVPLRFVGEFEWWKPTEVGQLGGCSDPPGSLVVRPSRRGLELKVWQLDVCTGAPEVLLRFWTWTQEGLVKLSRDFWEVDTGAGFWKHGRSFLMQARGNDKALNLRCAGISCNYGQLCNFLFFLIKCGIQDANLELKMLSKKK